MSHISQSKWAREMKALHREAAGCMEMRVILSGDLPDLMASARGGGATALLLLRTISHAVQSMEAQPKSEPPLCGCCSGPLDMGGMAFVVIFPAGVGSPERAMAMAICGNHGRDRESIRQAAIVGLRDIWPDARPITMTHSAGGRA